MKIKELKDFLKSYNDELEIEEITFFEKGYKTKIIIKEYLTK